MSKYKVTTTRLSDQTHEALLILKDRVAGTIDDGLSTFIRNADPELWNQAEEAVALQARLRELRRGDGNEE